MNFKMCFGTLVGMWLMTSKNLLSFEEVVVKGVHVNINSSGCSGEEACPLPGKKRRVTFRDLTRSIAHFVNH